MARRRMGMDDCALERVARGGVTRLDGRGPGGGGAGMVGRVVVVVVVVDDAGFADVAAVVDTGGGGGGGGGGGIATEAEAGATAAACIPVGTPAGIGGGGGGGGGMASTTCGRFRDWAKLPLLGAASAWGCDALPPAPAAAAPSPSVAKYSAAADELASPPSSSFSTRAILPNVSAAPLTALPTPLTTPRRVSLLTALAPTDEAAADATVETAVPMAVARANTSEDEATLDK